MTVTGTGRHTHLTNPRASGRDRTGRRGEAPLPEPFDEPGRDTSVGPTMQLLRIVVVVLGAAALLAVLVLQYGRIESSSYFRYFGVNVSLLSLTPNDFLVAGAEGLLAPAVTIYAVLLGLSLLNRLVLARLAAPRRRAVLRVLIPLTAALGALLVTVALLHLLIRSRLFWSGSATSGVALAAGTLLVVFAARQLRWAPASPFAAADPASGRRPSTAGLAEWGTAILLVCLGLFWAVRSHATIDRRPTGSGTTDCG
jgi:hypothetical protein